MMVNIDMGKTQERELITIAAANKETLTPEAADTINVVVPSDASQNRVFEWRVQIALYILLILVSQSAIVLLGRLYYDKGGKSKWMATLVQVAGFPVLFLLHKLFKKEKTPDYRPTTHLSPLKIASVYTFFWPLCSSDVYVVTSRVKTYSHNNNSIK
ncbi:hypothetical protein RND81_07G161000 [Saponaria officinalis]|uniref:Uncharacterized protein n=1 Tax=Saponaria officinalis TaxID=3572 RepID=A0AAW1JRV9_SAPOF